MRTPPSDTTRDHIQEYIWRFKPKKKGGMSQERLAESIGYNRKSLNEFLNGHTDKMPADVTENFYKLYNRLDRSTPWTGEKRTASGGANEYGATHERDVIALAIEDLATLLRDPNESDATAFYETVHVLYGILKQIGGTIKFDNEVTTSGKGNVV